MKWFSIISLALSFSAIVMVDTEKTSLWVFVLLLIWFLASAIVTKKQMLADLKKNQ